MLEIVYNFIQESKPFQINTNIFIACFTTCWARLKLYDAIQQLQPAQVLYFDTDSIIYLWRPGMPESPLGIIKVNSQVNWTPMIILRNLYQPVRNITAIKLQREKWNANYAVFPFILAAVNS